MESQSVTVDIFHIWPVMQKKFHLIQFHFHSHFHFIFAFTFTSRSMKEIEECIKQPIEYCGAEKAVIFGHIFDDWEPVAKACNKSSKLESKCHELLSELINHFELQSSAIITQFNWSRYLWHCDAKTRTQIGLQNSEQTPHISSLWASYEVSIVRIWEKIDCIILALHCT